METKIQGMMPTDFEVYVEERKRELGGKLWSFKGSPLCLCQKIGQKTEIIGGFWEFTSWLASEHKFVVKKSTFPLFRSLAVSQYKKHLALTKHTFVKLSFSSKETAQRSKEAVSGAVLIELFDEMLPNATSHFAKICEGATELFSTDGSAAVSNQASFGGCPVHRVVPGAWMQCGDLMTGSGASSVTVDGNWISDECYSIAHDRSGLVGLANQGPHTNSSQFYITFAPLPSFDGKYQVIGRVVEGMRTLRMINKCQTLNERPLSLQVSDSSVLDIEEL